MKRCAHAGGEKPFRTTYRVQLAITCTSVSNAHVTATSYCFDGFQLSALDILTTREFVTASNCSTSETERLRQHRMQRENLAEGACTPQSDAHADMIQRLYA